MDNTYRPEKASGSFDEAKRHFEACLFRYFISNDNYMHFTESTLSKSIDAVLGPIGKNVFKMIVDRASLEQIVRGLARK